METALGPGMRIDFDLFDSLTPEFSPDPKIFLRIAVLGTASNSLLASPETGQGN